MIETQKFSLDAYKHIRQYMGQRQRLDRHDLNAILRLSQHLRVFGLLSAVGYINHNQPTEQENNANEQNNAQTRQRTVTVWSALLGQLINGQVPADNQQLMEQVAEMVEEDPSLYMVNWRKSLIFSNHWNFWGKSYFEE